MLLFQGGMIYYLQHLFYGVKNMKNKIESVILFFITITLVGLIWTRDIWVPQVFTGNLVIILNNHNWDILWYLLALIPGAYGLIKLVLTSLEVQEKYFDLAPILKKVSAEQIVINYAANPTFPWVDYGVIHTRDLTPYRPLLLIERAEMGRSRQAAELIRYFLSDKAPTTQIYDITRLPMQFPAEIIQDYLDRNLNRTIPAVFFINDCHQYTPAQLKVLDLFFEIIQTYSCYYVLATARAEKITPEQEAWFKEKHFLVKEIKPLKKDQITRWVLAISDSFKTHLEENSIEAFGNHSDGTPAKIILAFRRLLENESKTITRDLVDQQCIQSLDEAWKEVRKEAMQKEPSTISLLKTLGIFYQAHIPAFTDLVMAYAEELELAKTPGPLKNKIHQKLSYSVHLLEPFGLQIVSDELVYPEMLLPPDLKSHEESIKALETFFENYRTFYRDNILCRFNKQAFVQQEALIFMMMQAYLQGDFSYAKTLSNLALEINPFRPICQAISGLICDHLQDFEGAVQAFQKAVELDPETPEFYIQMGKIYFHHHQYIEAIQANQNAINLAPTNPNYLFMLGKSFEYNRQFDEAIETYNKSIAIDHENPEYYFRRGQVFTSMGKHFDAIESYKRTVALNHRDARAYGALGKAYHIMQQYPNAIDAYSQAVLNDVKNASWYIGLGKAYEHHLKYGDAAKSYLQAIALDPQNAQEYYLLGSVCAKSQQYLLAIESFKNALNMGYNKVECYAGLGLSYNRNGQYTEAIKAYETAIALEPTNLNLIINLADVYDSNQQYPEAIEAYQRAITIDPKKADLYALLGSAYRNNQQYDQAIEMYQNSVNLAPNNARYYHNLGLMYRVKNDYKLASEAFQKAISLRPERAIYHFNLGSVLQLMGEETEAKVQMTEGRTLSVHQSEYEHACIEALCGNTEGALNKLAVALEKKQVPNIWARVDPDLTSLHDEARFWELLGH